ASATIAERRQAIAISVACLPVASPLLAGCIGRILGAYLRAACDVVVMEAFFDHRPADDAASREAPRAADAWAGPAVGSTIGVRMTGPARSIQAKIAIAPGIGLALAAIGGCLGQISTDRAVTKP